jgi:hypothetical protein
MKSKHHGSAEHARTTSAEAPFSVQQCDALFAAILVHDDIDLAAELPDTIQLDYSQEQFTRCYRICLQLWQQGVDRKFLIRVAEHAYRHRCLDPETQLTFKNMRAKFKHLRFANMTFDKRHCYPPEFHRVIRKMGNLQDALKHEQAAEVGRNAIFLRLLAINFVYTYSTWKITHFKPTTTAAFGDYVNREMDFIRQHLVEQRVTGRVFHEMRKVISRQVALYDNMKILYPSPYHREISAYLSTINGLMGNMHDELVTRHFDDAQDYESHTFEVPEKIRQRLTALTRKYQQPG